jgi:hypothetical protein
MNKYTDIKQGHYDILLVMITKNNNGIMETRVTLQIIIIIIIIIIMKY